jgi:hypothetical protein
MIIALIPEVKISFRDLFGWEVDCCLFREGLTEPRVPIPPCGAVICYLFQKPDFDLYSTFH